MSASPTRLSMKLLRTLGWNPWHCEVDIRIPREGQEDLVFKRDLFGILDIVALKEGKTLGVQSTSLSNVSSRVRKIECSVWFEWLRRSNWRIEVHGWDLENGDVRVINMLDRTLDWSSVLRKSKTCTQTELAL